MTISVNRKYQDNNPAEEICNTTISKLIEEANWSSYLNCTENQKPVPCPGNNTQRYRSYNGTCNNLIHPLEWGVAFTAFRRSLPPWYDDGIGKPRIASGNKPLPPANIVSAEVHRPLYRDDPKFTVMLAVWGQFLDHDITATALSHGKNGSAIACCVKDKQHPECFPVIDPDTGECIEFVRSAPAPSCCLGPRNQMNQATAYIDGSMIYGSEEELVHSLRTHRYGYLSMMTTKDGRDLLPPSLDLSDGCNREKMNQEGKYCFLSGDPRSNENLHLTTMHLLWARNHNNIAAVLYKQNSNWSDEMLFQEARHIVAAQIQHITYKEFLPIILGHELMQKYDLVTGNDSVQYKYNETVDASIANEFAAAAFRFAHTLIPGLMKILANDTSSPEYVQLHKMLFDPYRLYVVGELDYILKGAMDTNIEAADTYFTDELKSKLFQDPYKSTYSSKKSGCGGLDLVSLNIQRGRDHGLAGYTAWRSYCGLSKPQSFDSLLLYMDSDSVKRISELYSDVNDLDIYTGALSEKPLDGSLLGPTASCIIVDQFVRLKRGDRFWYENMNGPQAFTSAQLAEIKRTSLASVICENSDAIDIITPLVMQRENKVNINVPCSAIDKPDFTKWKDVRG